MLAGVFFVPVRRLLPVALVLALVVAAIVPIAASADSTSTSQMISYTNSARSQHGLRSYSVSSDLSSVASNWAAHMAANHTLAHNPNATSQVCCWQAMGENVGVGGSASQIQSAFMASAEHRSNILSSSYTQVGIGTAWGSDGRLYVDEVFRLPSGAAAPAAPRTSTTTHVTSQPYTPRASRSSARQPLVVRVSAMHPSTLHPSTLHPSTWHRNPVTSASRLTPMFLRQLRQQLPAQVGFDPVGGAFGYVQVMTTVILSPRHHRR
jgi:hypothetical protein